MARLAGLFAGKAEVQRREVIDQGIDLVRKEIDWLEANQENLSPDEIEEKVKDIRFLVLRLRNLM